MVAERKSQLNFAFFLDFLLVIVFFVFGCKKS